MAIRKKKLEKGEPMKGLLNNKEAVNIANRIDSMLENRLHQIYNLGYNEGYKDAVEEATRKIAEVVTEAMKGEEDESGTERD